MIKGYAELRINHDTMKEIVDCYLARATTIGYGLAVESVNYDNQTGVFVIEISEPVDDDG